MNSKAFILSIFALASAGVSAVDVYEPRLSPDVVVINDYMSRTPAGRHFSGVVKYRTRYEITSIIDYPNKGCSFTNGVYVTTYLGDEPCCGHGASSYDETIRCAVLTNDAVTVLSYARLMYGDAAVRQIVRAALERGDQYIESPYTTASACLYNPANIPVPMPNSTKMPFAKAGAKLNRNGLSDAIPIRGRCFGETNAVESLPSSVMPPNAVAAAEALDAAGRSYAIPTVGVAIHTPADYAHEFAHFANPTRSLPDETAASTGFSQETLNACTSWKEFLPAYHALKVDAWSRDIDLGAPGGWAAYWAIVGASVETIAALQGEMSADGVALLAAYREAKAAEGTANDNPDYARLRAWCESDSIGRMVL